MSGLNEEQLSFLASELQITQEMLSEMDEEAWDDLRFQCREIAENEIFFNHGKGVEEITDRVLTAQSIGNLDFKSLQGNPA